MKKENRLTMAKVANKSKTTLYIILAAVFGVLLIGAVGAFFAPANRSGSHDPTLLAVGAFFAAVLAFCIFKIRKLNARKRGMTRYRDYIARLSDDPEKSLVTLSQKTGVPLADIEADIAMLLKLGLIQNAYLDQEKKTLVFPKYELGERIPDAVMVNVKCECCCGSTEIPANTVGSCQYCGSPISAK
ncbi:MAG: hypothetical protein IJJ99_05615 [Oscillospiraceae bacterium]|nr:hypothetical protein [Oscillospiraceae bacterium]